jgi:hypothetical protein
MSENSDRNEAELILDGASFADWQQSQRDMRHNEEPTDDILAACSPAEAIKALLEILVTDTLKGSSVKSIGHKVLALANLLGVEPIGSLTLGQVAKTVGCTKALLSNYGIELSECLKLHFRPQKSEGSRAAYRAARNAAVRAVFVTRRAQRAKAAYERTKARAAGEG